MKEFVLVHMVDPAEVGARFATWPLHLTLLPWFEAPDLETVQAQLKAKLKDLKPFEVTVGERSQHGDYKGRPVMNITNTPELQRLHEQLLAVIQANHWPLQGRYTGRHYTPHVTQKAGRDAQGAMCVDAVFIAESQPLGYRQLVGKVELG